ncbi:arsenate reductase family protein [Brochothrix thermosphacta DSM 20171 = FSL F6-1036]|nr:arsenate reductase family protein [Brochothrix thermosphacta DSM 20171 = FSL F6-1036]
MKDKVDQMTDDDIFALLATDGMLIKRPLAFDDEKITLGFKEDNYENYWN